MADIHALLSEIVGDSNLFAGDSIHEDYTRDEALGVAPVRPAFLAKPASTDEVARIIAAANEHRVPVTARGSGTGLSGACVPQPDGILISFERMSRILEIDTENHIAVVEPGVTLEQLNAETAKHGLVYPVFPGEQSASLGGNVATNAGGMRAIKYGVTRHQVLGLTAVLGTGETITTGGKFVKSTSGYDLTQLIIGSEGTLAIATQAILKLYPRAPHAATLLAPFRSLDEITKAVPKIVTSGVDPMILEYIDFVAMAGILNNAGLDLGITDEIKQSALAYLVVVLEDRKPERLQEDIEEVGMLIDSLGALEIYSLSPTAGQQLIEAREKVFWSAKAAGVNDIIDLVVPRASISDYIQKVTAAAQESGSFLVGCGHVGDGNVHMSVIQADDAKRAELMETIFRLGTEMGGAVSGEHGIGTEKRRYFLAHTSPESLALQRRIKAAFDPAGILNPGVLFD
jgi:glycolate oxidase